MSLTKTIDKVLELEGKATPGLWRGIEGDTYHAYGILFEHGDSDRQIARFEDEDEMPRGEKDATFIAFTRNHIKQMALALKEAFALIRNGAGCEHSHRETDRAWLDKWDKEFREP